MRASVRRISVDPTEARNDILGCVGRDRRVRNAASCAFGEGRDLLPPLSSHMRFMNDTDGLLLHS
jgi:hypothetical protein